MCRTLIATLTILSTFAGAAAAAGNDWRADCRSSYDPDFGKCIVQRTGAQSAEAIRALGSELIRVLVFKPDRVDAPILLADIVQPKNGEDQLILHDALGKGVGRTYAFSRKDFETLRKQLMAMQGYGAVLHGAKPTRDIARDGHGIPEHICLHGASGWVQVVFGDGTVRATELNYCETVDYSFVDRVMQLASAADPVCGKISEYEMWIPLKLQACVHLSGERTLAADAYRLASRTAQWREHKRPPEESEIEHLIAPDMRFRVGGGTVTIGRTAAVNKWLRLGGTRWEIRYSLTGASATTRTAVVRGFIYRVSDDNYDEFRASSKQVWREDDTGSPYLTEWDVGPFKRYRMSSDD